MMKAVLDLFYATGDRRYYEYVRDFMDAYILDGGSIAGYDEDADRLYSFGMGKPLFDLLRISGDPKYEAAIGLLHSGIARHPLTGSGIFWHKKSQKNQVRLDSLYMVMPFYAEYDATFNRNRNYKDVFRQFRKVYEIMRDPATGLYFHGYDESKEAAWSDCETGLSPNFWAFACGAYAKALVDTIAKFDERFFYEYMTLQGYLKELLDALRAYRDQETDMLYQVPDEGGREGNFLETGASCSVAYALMKGARMGYLPAYCSGQGRRLFEQVARHRFDGVSLAGITRTAGLGGKAGENRDGSFSYYASLPRSSNSANGLAPFISAFAETLRR